MKPIEFKEQNVIYAEDQPEYLPLPALKYNSPNGEVVCCWKLSLFERLIILFTGRMWVALLSFNQPLTPNLLSVHKHDVIKPQ